MHFAWDMKQERQGSTVTENKQKLMALVSALEEENIVDYCYTFIGLKVYGKTRLPEGITAELRQLQKVHDDRCKQQELTPEEKEAMFYRAEIARAIYDITSIAILNYIYIIVGDVHKEAQEKGETNDNE